MPEMTSLEALEELKDWVKCFIRFDSVPEIVRGEIQQKFFKAYHGTLKHFEIIERDLKKLEEIKQWVKSFEYQHP